MKKYLLFFWLITSTITLFSQQITLGDLTAVLNKKGWYDIDLLLQNKNWEYYNSENNGFTQNVTWSYKMNFDYKASGWLTATIFDNKTDLIEYSCYNDESYKIITKDILKSGFTKGKDEINNDELKQVY
jgi:hypothetical protein